LRILEAKVENSKCSEPMLDDDGVQQGKNVSPANDANRNLFLGMSKDW